MTKNMKKAFESLSRREVIKRGLLGAAGLSLYGAARPAWAAAEAKPQAKAKSVIQIWMWGGASHLDTFDPKPAAGYDYCGPLDKPIATNVDGIQIGQLLPLLAKQADKYAIIRSMTHGINSHETASYMVQTGHEPGRQVFPCVGAVAALMKGYDHGYKGLVPPYVVLTKPQGRFSEAGFLGDKYKPFATGGDPNREPFAVEGIIVQGITDSRQESRRKLLENLDTLGKAVPKNPELEQFDRSQQKAFEMMFGDARKLFDLTQETEQTRQQYGRNTFGQSCLMARRLVEHGVPYITINYGGWDTHKQHFEAMRRKLPEMDQGMSALLEDLSGRGLLDTTIVWWTGEFGRTPKVQWESPWNGGRGHYGKCFSSVVAGGGFKGGRVVGSSNETGSEPASRPVYPQDVLRSMYMLLGIDPDGPLANSRGLEVKVMPPATGSSGTLTEIM
jgi:uncharacterized protein (DUF1501 family)